MEEMNKNVEENVNITAESAVNAENICKEQKTQSSGGATIQEFDYQTYERVEEKATKTSSTTGLVLGICSIVFSETGLIGLVLGILGIIFSVKGRKQEQGGGSATAGLVCSIIGVVLSLIIAFCIVGVIIAAVADSSYGYGHYYY